MPTDLSYVPPIEPVESEIRIGMFRGEQRGFDLAVVFAAAISQKKIDDRGKMILTRFIRDMFSLATDLAIPRGGPNQERCRMTAQAIERIQTGIGNNPQETFLKEALAALEMRIIDGLCAHNPAMK